MTKSTTLEAIYGKWHKHHEQNQYEVVTVRGGQVRPYGPTIYEYHVTDLTGKRTEEEVRDYCITEVKRADYPRRHSLILHLQKFERRADGIYHYICGHEWTG